MFDPGLPDGGDVFLRGIREIGADDVGAERGPAWLDPDPGRSGVDHGPMLLAVRPGKLADPAYVVNWSDQLTICPIWRIVGE
jgi:hypothetical protein